VAVGVEVVGRRVRRRRLAVGWSQADLAARAGVSRQAVGALEAGRHLPRVDAAVALARELGLTVEELFAAGSPGQVLNAVGGEVGDGRLVRAASVGDRTVVVPLPSIADGETWIRPDGVVRGGRLELLEGADLHGFLVAGCDPALGILAGLAPDRGPGRILPVVTSSAIARAALSDGRVHAAVVHDVVAPAPEQADRVHRLPLAMWRTGVAASPDRHGVLAAALDGRGPVVQREDGAAAQAAYRRALAAADRPVPTGPVARGHLDAARRASEEGVAAVTIEPVARALGLTFHPLETHTVELWIDAAAVDHPGARALGELLASVRLRSHLRVLPGYDLAGAA
jgi:DNA-binding XRE family transcriptional regulator